MDGLWLSFDDAGEGISAASLVEQVLAMAKKRGLKEHDIVMTPPAGSYHNIETQWNKTMASQSGMDDIVWFFTRTPCDCEVETARKIGLTNTLPGWWHHWPRPAAGLVNGPYGVSLYDKTPYFEPQPLKVGWHMPTYNELQKASLYTDTVVACASGAEEYVMPVLGIWAWDPQKHDWDTTRREIYSYVFGPENADKVKRFDDSFSELKSLFTKVQYKTKSPELWPPRLIDAGNKGRAAKLAEQMEAELKAIKAGAGQGAIVSSERLQKIYFEPMDDAVVYAKKFSSLEFPEYTLKGFAQKTKTLAAVQPEKVQSRIDQVKPGVLKQLEEIKTELASVQNVDSYIQYWNELLSGPEYYQKLIKSAKKRKADEKKRLAEMAVIFPTVVKGNYKELLKAQEQPPKGKVLAEITPAQIAASAPTWTGDGWGVGLYKAGKRQSLAIAFDPNKTCKAGDYVNVPVSLVIPEYKGTLRLQIFVAQQACGNVERYRGARSSVIALGSRWAWLQDSANSMAGNEWITLEVAASDEGAIKAGDTINILFHVTNTRTVENYGTTVFFGPIRLIEVNNE